MKNEELAKQSNERDEFEVTEPKSSISVAKPSANMALKGFWRGWGTRQDGPVIWLEAPKLMFHIVLVAWQANEEPFQVNVAVRKVHIEVCKETRWPSQWYPVVLRFVAWCAVAAIKIPSYQQYSTVISLLQWVQCQGTRSDHDHYPLVYDHRPRISTKSMASLAQIMSRTTTLTTP